MSDPKLGGEPVDKRDVDSRTEDPKGAEASAEGGEAWPLRPVTQGAPLAGVARVFAAGVTGGVLSLVGFGFMLPNLIPARGATRSLQIDRAQRQRCMELGITPEELAVLDAGEPRTAGD